MRTPVVLSVAIGCVILITADQAFSESRGYRRFPDAGLEALEKLGARAKVAMDAFVLRPRIAEPFSSVCSGCIMEVAEVPSVRIARVAARLSAQDSRGSGIGGLRLKTPRYTALTPGDRVKRTITSRQRFTHRGYRISRNHNRLVSAPVGKTWETELRL